MKGLNIVGRIVRHKKTGGEYTVVEDNAIIEATMTRAVIYRQIDGSTVWVRPYDEFTDGRFELTE